MLRRKNSLFSKESDDKPMILIIGGTYGVGKTTMALELSKTLNIYQRTGVGVIAKTLQEFLPNSKLVKTWDHYNNLTEPEIIAKFRKESLIVGKVITRIVNDATKNGQCYIIEGVQLLPEYLPLDKACFLVLYLSDASEHLNRLEHPKTTRRRQPHGITVGPAKVIEKYLLAQAEKFKIPVFENSLGAAQTSMQIIRQLKTKQKTAQV